MGFSLEDIKGKKSNVGGQLEVLKKGLQTNSSNLENRINSLASRKITNVKELISNNTELIIIIDRSTSRCGSERATVLGLNELIRKQKQKYGKTLVTIIFFDEESYVLYNRCDINKISINPYIAEGGTALYDTLCTHLKEIKTSQLTDAAIDPNKTVCVITTDGEDVSSIKYNVSDTRKVIKECKNIGWKFIFLGAVINAKKEAENLGIDSKYAVNFLDDTTGIRKNFETVSKVLDSVRETGEVSNNWSDNIERHNHLALNSGEDDGPRLTLKGGK